MAVGGSHEWNYPDGVWKETKVAPDRWGFAFTSVKGRMREAPEGSGAEIGSGFHWLIVADQKAIKTGPNNYDTTMAGAKFKVGHKRPNWGKWSYEYHDRCYEDIVIGFLQGMIDELEAQKTKRLALALGLDRFAEG